MSQALSLADQIAQDKRLVEENLPPLDNLLDEKDYNQIFEDTNAGCNIKYTPEQRLQACAYYTVLGNYNRVGRMMGIIPNTIAWWAKTPWWKSLLATIRKHRQDELDIKLTKIIHTAADELDDRLQHGNKVIDKDTKQEYRKPLTATEIATAGLGIAYDKRALLRGDVTSRVERIQSSEEVLKSLADQFVKLARSVNHGPEPIEGEIINDKLESRQPSANIIDTDSEETTHNADKEKR